MINNFNKKRGTIAINKIVVVILVVLVIAAVLMFLFKADILNYLRSLPGYSVPEEDREIDVANLTDEEMRSLCPVIIGKTKTEVSVGFLKDDYIYFCEELSTVCKTQTRSKLKVTGDKNNGEIEVDRWFDNTIGAIKNNKLILSREILEKNGNLYDEVKDDLPDFKYVINLNGSYYIPGNFICRKEVINNVV